MAKFYDIKPIEDDEPKKKVHEIDFDMPSVRHESKETPPHESHHAHTESEEHHTKKIEPDELMSQAPEIPRVKETQEEEQPSPSHHHDERPRTPIVTLTSAKPIKRQKWVTAVLTVVLVVLLALLASQAIIYYNNSKKSDSNSSSNNSGKVVIGDLNTSSASPSTTPSPTATPTTAPTTATTSKASLNVKILNGSGVTGAANKVSTLAKAAGFTVASTGNAKSYTYATTQVLYRNASLKDFATQLANALTGYTTSIKEDAATVGAAGDLVIIVGKK